MLKVLLVVALVAGGKRGELVQAARRPFEERAEKRLGVATRNELAFEREEAGEARGLVAVPRGGEERRQPRPRRAPDGLALRLGRGACEMDPEEIEGGLRGVPQRGRFARAGGKRAG